MGHLKVFMLAFTGVYISSTCANLVWVSISGSFQSVEFQNPPLSLNIQSSLVLRWGITSALGSCCLQPLSSFLQCKQDCVLCTGWIFLCTKNMGADRPSCVWCCVYRDHMAAAAGPSCLSHSSSLWLVCTCSSSPSFWRLLEPERY